MTKLSKLVLPVVVGASLCLATATFAETTSDHHPRRAQMHQLHKQQAAERKALRANCKKNMQVLRKKHKAARMAAKKRMKMMKRSHPKTDHVY